MAAEPIFYDIQEVATLLNCSPKAVRHRVARRLLPAQKLGKRVLFRKTELDQFLKNLPGVSLAEAERNWSVRQ